MGSKPAPAVRIDDVKDGTSNTAIVATNRVAPLTGSLTNSQGGEYNQGMPCIVTNPMYGLVTFKQGYTGTRKPNDSLTVPSGITNSAEIAKAQQNIKAIKYGACLDHNVGFLDGSVRWISANTDASVIEAMSTRHGGEIVNLP